MSMPDFLSISNVYVPVLTKTSAAMLLVYCISDPDIRESDEAPNYDWVAILVQVLISARGKKGDFSEP